MQLSKAFDPQALVKALESQGVQDAEKLVNDAIPVVFDWINSSVAMEPVPFGLGALVGSILAEVESKAQAALVAAEAKL